MNNFEISWATLWRIFFMLILAAGLFLVRDVLIILFLAIIISSALDAPVSFLEKKRFPRVLATLLIFIVAMAILAFLLYTIIPASLFEFKELLKDLDKLEGSFLGILNIPQFNTLDFVEKLDKNLGNLTDALFSGSISFFGLIIKVFGNIILIITTLILSFYLTINRDGVEKFLKAILPINIEGRVIEIYLRSRKKLGLWFQGQLLLMGLIGVTVFLGLWILGVKYSLILGVLAGLLEIVPLAGPIFAGALSFLIAASTSWVLGFYVILLFVVIQQLENHLLVPLVMKKTVGISPVVVVIALLAGSQIAGLVGMILAVPTAVVFQELIEDYERRKLKARNE